MARKTPDYSAMFTLRSDGRYCYTYTLPDGRRKYLYSRDPAALYAKIKSKDEPAEIRVKDAAGKWWNSHVEQLSRGTQAAYSAPFEYICEQIGDSAITSVTAADIKVFMDREKSKGYSYKHAACVLSLLRQIFDYAIAEMGVRMLNPCAAVKIPRGLKRSTREAPEDDIIQIILRHADDPNGLLPLFLLYTGFRIGEALGVKWEDIDFKNSTVSCRRSIERRFGKPYEAECKTDSAYRTVPLLDGLREHLDRPAGAGDEDYVFNIDGRLMTNSELRARWTSWSKGAGLAELKVTSIKGKDGKPHRKTYYRSKLTCHQLRHGYATLCYEAGIDELACVELLGHADAEMVRRVYTHLRRQRRASAAQLLNDKFREIESVVVP